MRKAARSTKKILVLIIGIGVIVAGVVMLVIPGPGLLTIILGLAILATEFEFAKKWLDMAKHQYQQESTKIKKRINKNKTPKQPEQKDVKTK